MIVHKNIRIYGKVQGVGFRYTASVVAKRLKLTGFVRNEPDGSVYAEAEGEEKALMKFEGWCHQGPVSSKVSEVISQPGDVRGFSEFKVF